MVPLRIEGNAMLRLTLAIALLIAALAFVGLEIKTVSDLAQNAACASIGGGC